MQLISFSNKRGRNSQQNDTLSNIVTLLFNLSFQSELRPLTGIRLDLTASKMMVSREPLKKLKKKTSFFFVVLILFFLSL